MKKLLLLLLALAASAAPTAAQRGAYYPGPGDDWQRRAPAQAGMDSARLAEAIAFARAAESRAPRDLQLAHYQSFGREPFGQAVGPFRARGEPTGVILRGGYLVAEWGEPERPDMAFSVTKSFLSTVVGLAFDRGLIGSLQAPVARAMAPVVALDGRLGGGPQPAERFGEPALLEPFADEHNRQITWEQLLRQTSGWRGTLWGKPDWADRPAADASTWLGAERAAPGTAYEYNDTRVNLLALAALNVWRRPLPQVLKQEVMDPIGASQSWRWLGYETSWVLIDGVAVQSVSGGGHWGGGMFISARDLARFGLLTQRGGRWRERQLLSERWLAMARTPTPQQPTYGFMNFFLNTERKLYPSAPASAFAHVGNGTNLVYVDAEHDLVAVVRWIRSDQIDGFLQRLLASVGARAPR